MPTLLVAVLGAAGAVARYRIGVAVGVRTFPWATLGINLAGSFALAWFLAGPLPNRIGVTVTVGVAVGLLGGFTTYSTFGFETVTLLREQRIGAAAMYVGLSVVGGLAAAAVGYVLGRAMT